MSYELYADEPNLDELRQAIAEESIKATAQIQAETSKLADIEEANVESWRQRNA